MNAVGWDHDHHSNHYENPVKCVSCGKNHLSRSSECEVGEKRKRNHEIKTYQKFNIPWTQKTLRSATWIHLCQSSPVSLCKARNQNSFHSIQCSRLQKSRNQVLKQGYRYHKLQKTFSKFYRRHYELVSKFNVGLKTLLHEGLSEPEFYSDLVYKFKKIVGRADFFWSVQKKIIVRYKRIGYNINIMRQSACLVFNPITVNNFASFFNCTLVGRASDSMMAPT